MKFLVLGGDGMVGAGVLRALRRHYAVGTTRADFQIETMAGFAGVVADVGPDVIVNCIGVIPQRSADAEMTIEANALFPHRLRRHWGGPLIHISTDCALDATIYGRSKLLGEVAMTLRCCVVGFSAKRKVGFLDWFVFKSPAEVEGWRKAYFSPITNLELGRAVEAAARHYCEGIFAVAGERLSKFEYLQLVNEALSLGKTIRPVDDPAVDKSNDDPAFAALTGWTPPPNEIQINELKGYL